MAKCLILQDYFLRAFLPVQRCAGCNATDPVFHLAFPRMRWMETKIELMYPMQCACGKRGLFKLRLPTLIFGYMLAVGALRECRAAHHRKSSLTLRREPASLGMLLEPFDRLAKITTITDLQSMSQFVRALSDGSQRHDDEERRKFGFDEQEWRDFLRRLGVDDGSIER